jgi:hypothetical protein
MNNEEIYYSQFLINHDLGKLDCNYKTAARALRPTAQYGLSEQNGEFVFSSYEDYGGLPPPTKEEILDELEFQKRFCAYWQHFYSRYRSYPDITVMFNLLWNAIDSGQITEKTSDFYKVIKQVNEQYPCPDGEPPSRTNRLS